MKKLEREKAEKWKKNEATKPDKLKEKNKKKKVNKDSEESVFVAPPSRPRKRTNDGLTVYTEEELGIANADVGDMLMKALQEQAFASYDSFTVGNGDKIMEVKWVMSLNAYQLQMGDALALENLLVSPNVSFGILMLETLIVTLCLGFGFHLPKILFMFGTRTLYDLCFAFM
ncbi:unnamed protein product [Camellia sinensis]